MRACRLRPRSDCVVEIAKRSLAAVVRTDVRTDALFPSVPPDPAVIAHELSVAAASLADPLSDFERLQRALPGPVGSIELLAAAELAETLRGHHWRARVFQRGSAIVAVRPPGRQSAGLAIDLGTTNVAGVLIDLASGARLAALGIENPQSAWGGDVISRLNYAIGGRSCAQELRQAACTAIDALGHDLCRAVGLHGADILDIAVCANTAMQHLLLGLPVRQLGRAPFVAALRDAVDLPARELGLRVAPAAAVHVAPNIGGFVGSDHVAALLATRSRWAGAATSLVVDIGTNTEISLIHHGRILSASCPSGPALEGGHISCGMRAAEGAIERVWLNDGRLCVATIGERPAVGVCGSGILDAIAAALQAGLLDRGGRIGEGHADIVEIGGRRAIQLAPEVHISQADIRAVQLAKAAIRTGIDLLLEQLALAPRDVDQFIVAGAFGSYIDIGSARAIGLFPPLAPERFARVGNAAGVGITWMLASRAERAAARELAARCSYVELSTRPEFQKRFMKSIGFAPQPEGVPS